MNVTERFLEYIAIPSQSAETGENPSTPQQWDMAKHLAEDLKALGLADAKVTEYGIVMATIPANNGKEGPVLGFIAHMDTSPDASGTDIKPQIVKNYDGGKIALSGDMTLDPAYFPELLDYVGQDIITTDGTTLLGADDKAGVAEIVAMAQELMAHPEWKHGPIRIAFTPDEEVGAGTDKFDVAEFGADYAYTVDGGKLGELEFENFNAAGATVTIHGVGIHPGYAKDAMVNAASIGAEFDRMLPEKERPQHTEGYEGFYHLTSFQGSVTQAELHYIIRDHDSALFAKRKETMAQVAQKLNQMYGEGTVEVSVVDNYYNMREKIEPHMHLIDSAREAFQAHGVKVIQIPVRGGTDGAKLSFMGLPCPNLSTGGHNFHGVYEYIPVQSLEKMVQVLCTLACGYGK